MVEKEKYMFGFGGLAVALIVAIFVFSIPQSGGVVGSSISYHSNVCVDKIVDGEFVNVGCQHNVLTNGGKTYIQLALTGASTNMSELALGNGTIPVVGDTALNGLFTSCGLSKANATYSSNGVGNWSQVYTWTSTCDNVVVNTTALYKQGGNMFAGTTFVNTTLQTNDQIRVNYTVAVS